MNKSLIFKNKLYNFSFILFTCFIFMYLFYHLLFSSRGLFEYFKLNNEYNKEKLIYLSIKNNNINLDEKINKLDPKNIDIDFLEEVSRKKIGYLRNNEIIIISSD